MLFSSGTVSVFGVFFVVPCLASIGHTRLEQTNDLFFLFAFFYLGPICVSEHSHLGFFLYRLLVSCSYAMSRRHSCFYSSSFTAVSCRCRSLLPPPTLTHPIFKYSSYSSLTGCTGYSYRIRTLGFDTRFPAGPLYLPLIVLCLLVFFHSIRAFGFQYVRSPDDISALLKYSGLTDIRINETTRQQYAAATAQVRSSSTSTYLWQKYWWLGRVAMMLLASCCCCT